MKTYLKKGLALVFAAALTGSVFAQDANNPAAIAGSEAAAAGAAAAQTTTAKHKSTKTSKKTKTKRHCKGKACHHKKAAKK